MKLASLKLLPLCILFAVTGHAQTPNMKAERDRARVMITSIKNDVKKNYYDPTFKGIDLDAKAAESFAKIEKAESVGQMHGIVAQFLVDFDDSHMFFNPPEKANETDFGVDFEMIGSKCFVTKVKKDSDAEKKGLQPGDEIYAINGIAPVRENLWKLRYSFFYLRPQPALKFITIKPDGKIFESVIVPKITVGKRLTDLTENMAANNFARKVDAEYEKETTQYYHTVDDVYIWKMPAFNISPDAVDSMFAKAERSKGLIIDLRGNSGGYLVTLQRLLGNLFDHNVKIGDEKRRKETKEQIAKTRGKDAYSGKLVVLIDSESASASELLARVVQIEKRGTVVGDVSEGAVMEAQQFSYTAGLDVIVPFGASITVADLIMTDGKSLEKVGVAPDVVLLPTGKDMSLKRDVALSKALDLLGKTVTPEAAGAFFSDINADKN
ncbi:MAG: PDZ domain-containing protein [Acidobacteria bacterium]|nr:PDZ domain-containing protein [Acidobacteriota bacterium]